MRHKNHFPYCHDSLFRAANKFDEQVKGRKPMELGGIMFEIYCCGYLCKEVEVVGHDDLTVEDNMDLIRGYKGVAFDITTLCSSVKSSARIIMTQPWYYVFLNHGQYNKTIQSRPRCLSKNLENWILSSSMSSIEKGSTMESGKIEAM